MSITQSGQEFIDRETQLPADTRMIGAGVTPGVLDGVPLGDPAIDYDVRSTFDVRPVNGFDFEQSGSADFFGGEGAGNVSVIAFTVPMGYVAVIRQWNFSAIVGGTSLISAGASLQRNGVDVPYNTNVNFDASGERKPCFILVDEGQTVGGRATFGVDGTATMLVYGTLLLKTGRAYPYEIANPVGVMRQTTLAPEPLYPPPSQPPKEVVREAPSTAVQQPAAPVPVSDDPPWPVTWVKQTMQTAGSCYAGNAMYWTPMRPVNGSPQRLTSAEAAMYSKWLSAHCPAPEKIGFRISNR